MLLCLDDAALGEGESAVNCFRRWRPMSMAVNRFPIQTTIHFGPYDLFFALRTSEKGLFKQYVTAG
jgi:hypothetical protein